MVGRVLNYFIAEGVHGHDGRWLIRAEEGEQSGANLGVIHVRAAHAHVERAIGGLV
jgi:hypothetical protein